MLAVTGRSRALRGPTEGPPSRLLQPLSARAQRHAGDFVLLLSAGTAPTAQAGAATLMAAVLNRPVAA